MFSVSFFSPLWVVVSPIGFSCSVWYYSCALVANLSLMPLLFPVYRSRKNGPQKVLHWIAPVFEACPLYYISASHTSHHFYHHLIRRALIRIIRIFTSIPAHHPSKIVPIDSSYLLCCILVCSIKKVEEEQEKRKEERKKKNVNWRTL